MPITPEFPHADGNTIHHIRGFQEKRSGKVGYLVKLSTSMRYNLVKFGKKW